MSSQRTLLTGTQALHGYAPICMEIQDYNRRIWVCPSIFQRSWCVSPVKDSPLDYISSLSPDGEGAGFRGEVRAPHSCERLSLNSLISQTEMEHFLLLRSWQLSWGQLVRGISVSPVFTPGTDIRVKTSRGWCNRDIPAMLRA